MVDPPMGRDVDSETWWHTRIAPRLLDLPPGVTFDNEATRCANQCHLSWCLHGFSASSAHANDSPTDASVMDELRRLQAQLRRMRQNRSPAADCYQLWRRIERLKYQLALGLFPDVGD
jgi:hypothetical protein